MQVRVHPGLQDRQAAELAQARREAEAEAARAALAAATRQRSREVAMRPLKSIAALREAMNARVQTDPRFLEYRKALS